MFAERERKGESDDAKNGLIISKCLEMKCKHGLMIWCRRFVSKCGIGGGQQQEEGSERMVLALVPGVESQGKEGEEMERP